MADRTSPVPDGASADRDAHRSRPPWWQTPALARHLFPGTDPPPPAPEGVDGDPAEFDFANPGQCEFGDYRLLALLGGGGMGRVYRAHQHSLDRDVALKLLSTGLWAAPDVVDRLRREARDAAVLKHPNIVTVYEVGEHRGRVYFAMELVDGRSLGEHLRQHGPLSPREAAKLLRMLAETVDYAHRLGVLHLDLNPGNVLLGPGGGAKITDFGLARRVVDGNSVATDRISGTPGYIAPEQVELSLGRLCAATDVWGLGATLYEVLSGHPPFEAHSAQATIELVLHGRVRDPRRYRHDLPRDLQAICLHCLRKRPIARYATARGLADDLGRYLEGHEVRVRPLNPLQRAGRWMRREPMLAVAGVLTVLSLVIALAALLADRL